MHKPLLFHPSIISDVLSSCFRTNTIILIDASGNVTFTERTMLNCDVSQWSTSSFQFKLKDWRWLYGNYTVPFCIHPPTASSGYTEVEWTFSLFHLKWWWERVKLWHLFGKSLICICQVVVFGKYILAWLRHTNVWIYQIIHYGCYFILNYIKELAILIKIFWFVYLKSGFIAKGQM